MGQLTVDLRPVLPPHEDCGSLRLPRGELLCHIILYGYFLGIDVDLPQCFVHALFVSVSKAHPIVSGRPEDVEILTQCLNDTVFLRRQPSLPRTKLPFIALTTIIFSLLLDI
jgi:hypothetical protein